MALPNFNTSYVLVKASNVFSFAAYVPDFNTSYVLVKVAINHDPAAIAMQFQYILCSG